MCVAVLVAVHTVHCCAAHSSHRLTPCPWQRGRQAVVENLLRLQATLGFEIFPSYLLKGKAAPPEGLTDSPLHRAVAGGHAAVCRTLLQVSSLPSASK